MSTTPEDVTKVLQVTINFMSITLLGEDLSPSSEMERQDTVERLENLILSLNKIKGTGFPSAEPSAPKQSGKFWKNEKKPAIKMSPKKVAVSPISSSATERPGSVISSYMDMDGESLSNPDITESTEQPEQENEVIEYGEDYEVPVRIIAGSSSKDNDVVKNNTSYESVEEQLKCLQKCSLEELKKGATYSGYLMKHKKRVLTKWHRRYCVLKDDFFFYFKSESDKKEQGVIIIPGYTLSVPPKDKGFLFTLERIDKNKDAYVFQADCKEDFEQWKTFLSIVTSKTLNIQQMGILNQVTYESSENDSVEGNGGGRVEELCATNIQPTSTTNQGETYDDILNVTGQDTQDTYDNIVSKEASNNEEIYDDVADSAPLIVQRQAVQKISQDDIYNDVNESTSSVNQGLAPSMIASPESAEAEEPTADDMYEFIPVQQLAPLPVLMRSPMNFPPSEVPRPVPASTPTSDAAPFIPPRNLTNNTGNESEFSLGNVYMGLYNCSSEDPDDLSFNRGDVMYILDEIDMNWWLGFLNGKVGLVPSNFLTEAFD